MGGRKRDRRTGNAQQYSGNYLGRASLGIQGTYKYEPEHYNVYTTDNSAETGSYSDASYSNKPSDDNSFEETISYGNTRWSRRKILVGIIIGLLGVVVLGAIAGIVIAVVDSNEENSDNTPSALQGGTTVPDQPTYPQTTSRPLTAPTVIETTTPQTTATMTTLPSPTSTVSRSPQETDRQSASTVISVTTTVTPTTTAQSTAVDTSSSVTVVKSSLASTSDMSTTVSTAQRMTTSSTETGSRKSCELPVEGRFYIWIPVAEGSDTVLIFNEIEGLVTENDAICFVENLGLIRTVTASRKKRNTEHLYFVIGIAVTTQGVSKADVIAMLNDATLIGVYKDSIRVESVAGDCVLLGTTGSVSESLCRDLGFIYSYFYDYELMEGIEWKTLPEFQEDHTNISCDPTLRDLAFCSEYYPDCKDEKQLCQSTCTDVQRNCPSAFEDLELFEDFCETLPQDSGCFGNTTTTACDKETEFECPQSRTCISLASVCDGNVDCPLSGFDEDEILCDTQPNTTTTTNSVTRATSPATPALNDCAEDEFACFSDGVCIPDYWYCDDYQDCSDNSDEEACDCPEGKFRCRVSIPTVCIDEDLLCNNVADCKDSSDEGDCASKTVECKEDEFKCIKFPECVNNSRKCDGTYDCQDKSDEWYGCPNPPTEPLITEFEVRLMQNATDTTAEEFGRVEIREKGSQDDFGSICDDMWTEQDALVVCRMLNTSFEGEAYSYVSAAFGVGSGNFVMTNVDCHGNETDIGLCKSKRTNIHCGNQQHASVSCGKEFDKPAPPSQEKVIVRLKNGDTCLEGLVQVYIEEEWRFVCDDRFDERDATVICRMLGYDSGPAVVQDVFGIGDGVFWLDEVNCRGNETDISQCAYNEPGDHDCVYYEAVGVVCGGIPEIDCNPEPDCITSPLCTFDKENCCFDFVIPPPEHGSTRWVWHKAEMIGYPDHTTNSLDGGVIYYRNNFGSEGDRASVNINNLLKSNISVSMETNLSIHFHYLVQAPHSGALSLMLVNADASGVDIALWTLPYTPKEMEGVWLYQCVDVDSIPTDMDLVYESIQGHEQNEMVAVDDVLIKNGKCQNGIAYQPCSFDVLSLCNVEIDCDQCKQNEEVYRWRILSNWTEVSSQLPEPYVEGNEMKGSFMLADASYGEKHEKAVLTFTVSESASHHAVKFGYLLMDNSAVLQVSIATEGNSEYLWSSQSSRGQKLHVGCVMLPDFSSDIVLNFEALRGSSLYSDIALDNVEVVEECQGFQSCLSGHDNCNFTAESSNEDVYTWTKTHYDGVKVVWCKFVSGDHSGNELISKSSFYVYVESNGQTQSIFKIEDNQSSFGSWSRLLSPEFAIKNGQYKLRFSLLKQGTGRLYVFITDGLTRHNVLTEHFYYADDYEKHCLTLSVGDMNGAVLVFESVKGSLGFYEDILNNTEVVYIKDIDLQPGLCNGSLADGACSFEDKLCDFNVESSSGSHPCDVVYGWTRTGGSLDYELLKSDKDHTMGNQKGHYMSVVKPPNFNNGISTIHFHEIEIQDMHTTLSLSCHIRIFDLPSENSELYINVSGLQYDIMNQLLPVDVWQPVCIELTNLQVASLDISITAKSITVDLDDVELRNSPCAVFAACSFDTSNICGYILENGWVYKGTHLEVSRVSSRLISPILNTDRDSCITFRLSSKTNSSFIVSGLIQILDKETLQNISHEERFKVHLSESNRTQIQFQFPAVADGVLALSFSELGTDEVIAVDEIIFDNYTCPVLVCDKFEHTCGNSYCLPAEKLCDGIEDCSDKSDEIDCDICDSCYFTILGECSCSYNSFNVIPVIEEGQPDPEFQFSAQNFLSFIETPVLNLTSFTCLKMRGIYVDMDINLRVVRNDSGLLALLDVFQYKAETTDYMNISLTLEPGLYSVIVEVIVLQPDTNLIAVTVEDMQVVSGVCETDNTKTIDVSTSTESPDSTTAIQGEMETLSAYLFTDIILECIVNDTYNMEEMTLFWYKEGRQFSRNDEIIQQSYTDTPNSINTPKYAVHMKNSTSVFYYLTVRKVTEEDGGLYECRLDSASNGLSVERAINVQVITSSSEKTGNGCFRNTLEVCYQHGFDMVSHSGPFQRGQDNQGLIFALNILRDDTAIEEECKSALESLTCGLFTPKCVNGSDINIYREYCLEIVSVCLVPNSDIYQLLQYGCAFLEDSAADSACYSEWIGCQMTHTSTSGVVWSENFPETYTETNCTTYIQADRYHRLQLNILDFDVGPGNGVDPCYFEIYDEPQEVLVLRKQCGETLDNSTIDVTGGLARIIFVSDNESQGRGYKIAYEQELRYGCALINVDVGRLHLTPDSLHGLTEDHNKQCLSALLYTGDERDLIMLEVRVVSKGCISLSTINKNGSVDLYQTLCDIVNTAVIDIVGQILLDIGEGVDDFSISIQRKKYVRHADTVNLDEYGRLLVTSEGEAGQACVMLDQLTADILCKSLNLGWPADISEASSDMETLHSIVSDISCDGTETQITECRFKFYTQRTCSGNDYNVVKCGDVTLSCMFYDTTCGYIIQGDIDFQKTAGLVLQKPSYFSALPAIAEITSPMFQYSDDSYVHLEYSIDWGVEDTITVELVDVSTDAAVILWERKLHEVSGYLSGCFRLPDRDDTTAYYRLNIKLSSYRTSAGAGLTSIKTAIRKLNVSPVPCSDTSAMVSSCNFENLETCASMLDLDGIACSREQQSIGQVHILPSGSLYRDTDWLKEDDTPNLNHNNFMLIDEGLVATILKNVTAEVLRFRYGIYTAPESDSYLSWRLIADEHSIKTFHSERTTWKSFCIDVKDYMSSVLKLEVGELAQNNTGTVGYGSIAIDDIQLSSNLCPDPVSCGFEDSCVQYYTSENNTMGWKKVSSGTPSYPLYDVTYKTPGVGSFMAADFLEAKEGSQSILEIENVGNTVQCLSFYLFVGKNSSAVIEVVINTRDYIPVNQALADVWLLHNIELSDTLESIQFVATRGITNDVIALDEVVFTDTPCNDILDRSNICTFDNPTLCRVRTPVTQNSQFKPRRLGQAAESETLSRLKYDADGKLNGTFMYLEGSSTHNRSAEMHFTVNTSRTAYRFWYLILDGASNTDNDIRLFTAVDNDDDDNINDDGKELHNNASTNAWMMSPCYFLPSPFSGTIRVHAEIETGQGRLLAIDNVQLVDKNNCEDYSLSCNFGMDQVCGYISVGQTWTRTSDSWFTTQSGNLSAPVTQLQNSSYCFEFIYEVYDTHTVDGQSKLLLLNDQKEVWYHYGKLNMRNEGPLSSRINIQGGFTQLKFVSEGVGIFKILRTSLTEGACTPVIDCDPVDEFHCQEKCINREMECDRVVDCLEGEDEAQSTCDFKMTIYFNNITTIEQSGFKVGSESSADWMLSASEILFVNDESSKISEQTLMTKFNTLSVTPSYLVSRQYFVSMETSCLYLSYYGNVTKFTLSQLYEDETKNMDYDVTLTQSLSKTHLAIPVEKGIVQFQLSVFMVTVDPYYRGTLPTHAIFGLYSFELHEGVECSDLPISCPADIPHLCRNKMSCYTEDQKCNLKFDCMDRSDETNDCGYGILCNFEHPNMCGYHNLTEPKTYWDDRDVYQTPQTLWQRTYTSVITRPNFDHTFGETGKGHFMTSKHYEGLQDEIRYVDTEIMQSPYQTFTTEGCITFWYYLNSTAHQPKTGTAQLFVYLQYGDDGLKELLWYDHVNKPFTDWVQGGIPVHGGKNVSLILKAVTFIPFDSWTGVVSIDDIDYHEGSCTVQKPDCDDTMYRCDDNICIPHEFVCDGEPDCHLGTEELNCEDRPNGGLQLVGGDRSYGQLGYYYTGQWRPVCYPEDPLEERLFTLNAAQKVCRTLGFSGNYDTFPYRFWSKHSDTSIELTCDSDGECSATPTTEDCGFFAYIRCSDEVCFSGEILCPDTQSTCKPRHYFCDGEMDCPGNLDEVNCKCFEEENQCLHIKEECVNRTCNTCEERDMFECKNHQCIPRAERCDGVTQCMDGTDEYRCVQIDEAGLVSVYHRESQQRKVVCVNEIDLNIAQTLCEFSGKGYVREILRSNTSITDGVSVTVSGDNVNVDTAAVFGDCYPLKLMCEMTECGTTSIQESLVQTYIINGRDASIEEWPWYAVLLGYGFLYCGATLVSPEWLVTATHCIYSGVEYSVVLGVDKWGSRGGSAQIVPVSRIYNYGYDSSGAYPLRDMTLLKLSQPVQINNFTRPICFPRQSTAEYIRQQGTKAECYIVGFGATEKIFNDPSSFDYSPDVLQKKRVRIVSHDLCEREWRIGVPSDDPFPENVYCFATEGPSSPSCFGDSGGPVTCKNARGRWELIGTISFGFGNCHHDIIPTVATSILQYGSWIEQITGFTLE